MESHRPHRPSKIKIWSPTDLPQTLQSSTTDPTDHQKDYLFSIVSPTDPTDLPYPNQIEGLFGVWDWI